MHFYTNMVSMNNNPLCKLSGIVKFYQNEGVERRILENIDYSVSSGSSTAIIGPSGSGKSTLLNILGLLDTPNAGKVEFMGKETSSFSADELSDIRNKHIGFVFQLHYLLPQLSLIENILVPTLPEKDKNKRNKAVTRAKDLLNFVGLADKSNQRPSQLSVGESQRAAVVRALINEPELVLADEPTGSLDFESALRMAELFSDLSKNFKVGLVVVTHSAELASGMQSVYRLRNGVLIPE